MNYGRTFCSLFMVVAVGCSRNEKKQESTTAGTSSLLVTTEYADILKAEVEKFTAVYPGVKLTISGTTTRESIVALLNEQIRTACVDRPMNAEERTVAANANLTVAGTVIGYDALAIVVNPANAVEHMSHATLRKIVWGETTSWNDVPGSNLRSEIDLVLTGKNSGTYELLRDRFFVTTRELAATHRTQSSQQSVEYVNTQSDAMSIVPLTVKPMSSTGLRVVALEPDSGWTETPFVLPAQMAVYQKAYPLRYEILFLNAEKRLGVGAGLGSFILTTAGQRIVQNAGLVPAHIPYNAIQLTSE